MAAPSRRKGGPLRRYLWIFGTAALVLLPIASLPYLANAWDLKLVRHLALDRPQVAYFGDSSLDTVGPCESDRRSIPEIFAKASARQTLMVGHPAFGPWIFRKIAPLVASTSSIDTVIVPVDLRAFSSEWFMNPLDRFVGKQIFYSWLDGRPALDTYFHFRFLDSPGGLDARYNATEIVTAQGPIGTIRTLNDRIRKIKRVTTCPEDYSSQAALRALRYNFYYGEVIPPDHPNFTFLLETLAPLAARKKRVFFYITPVDLEEMAALGGPALISTVRRNLATIRAFFAARGLPLLDLSGGLADRHFIERFCTCSHLDGFGRAYVAEQVAQALKR